MWVNKRKTLESNSTLTAWIILQLPNVPIFIRSFKKGCISPRRDTANEAIKPVVNQLPSHIQPESNLSSTMPYIWACMTQHDQWIHIMQASKFYFSSKSLLLPWLRSAKTWHLRVGSDWHTLSNLCVKLADQILYMKAPWNCVTLLQIQSCSISLFKVKISFDLRLKLYIVLTAMPLTRLGQRRPADHGSPSDIYIFKFLCVCVCDI